jgi:hypothetical protein
MGKTMNILIISFSYLHKDPRVINQIEVLKNYGQIYTLGFSPYKYHQVHFDLSTIIGRPNFYYHYPAFIRKFYTLFFAFLRYLTLVWNLIFLSHVLKKDFDYWKFIRIHKLKKLIKKHRFDLLWVNDIEALPMGVFLKRHATKLIFDAHEYFLEEVATEEWIRKYQNERKQRFLDAISFIDAMVTVNDSIAALFKTEFGVQPFIIRNVKKYHKIDVQLSKGDKIRLVHHGAAFTFKSIEKYIDFFSKLPDHFELHFYLTKNDEIYFEQIRKMASNYQRIYFHDPVPFDKIVQEISQYDIGLYFLTPDSYNNLYSLPNKIFEFIQARLMIIISPLPECKKIIDRYGCGIVLDVDKGYDRSFDVVRKLKKAEVLSYKQQSDLAARELNVENEAKIFEEILQYVFLKND